MLANSKKILFIFTVSQSGLGWQGPLGPSAQPLPNRATRAGCPGPHPGGL